MYKTIHGLFQFQLQKYLVQEERTNYFKQTAQLEAGYILSAITGIVWLLQDSSQL